VIFLEITEKKNAKAKFRLVQHWAAISATTEHWYCSCMQHSLRLTTLQNTIKLC